MATPTKPEIATLKHVKDSNLDMPETVNKTLEGLRGDASSIARDIGLNRLLESDGIDHLIEKFVHIVHKLSLSSRRRRPGAHAQLHSPQKARAGKTPAARPEHAL